MTSILFMDKVSARMDKTRATAVRVDYQAAESFENEGFYIIANGLLTQIQ